MCVPSQRISGVFPSLQGHAKALLVKMQAIRDTTDRDDLRATATTFGGALERRIPTLAAGGALAVEGEEETAKPVKKAEDKKGKEPVVVLAAKHEDAPKAEPAPRVSGAIACLWLCGSLTVRTCVGKGGHPQGAVVTACRGQVRQ